jgi:hypothetical protein
MIKCLIIKTLLFYRLSINVSILSMFMVVSTMGGESRRVYGGLFIVGGYDERYFCPT